MRKKVDQRIRTLVENGVKLNERSMFVVVGDRGREQVVNLHYMLSKATAAATDECEECVRRIRGRDQLENGPGARENK